VFHYIENMSQRSPAQIDRILRPREQEVNYGGEESDSEVDYVEDRESSETEASCSEGELDEVEDEIEDEEDEAAPVQRHRRKFVYGKDKYKWCLETPETRGRRSDSLRLHLPAAEGNSLNASNPYESWNVLFTDEMLELILKWTNTEIERHNIDNNANNAEAATFAPLSINELKAFIGLLYYQGVNKNNHLNLTEMWSNEFGSNLYRTVMSEKRFSFIGARLRFDDKSTRAERRTVDVLAPIRELWDLFIGNCQKNYTPGNNLTIDEQLLGFRGKFSARVYIPSKPARYGIKILSLNDSKNFYLYNAIPYTGKVQPERAESVPTFFVRCLSEPIHDSGRIITCDNWFSSVECFKKMLESHDLRMIGTLRKNKRQIPESFKRTASAGIMRVGYDGKLSLTSYCPKKNKVVLVLSSMHKSVKMNEDKLKPETILYYNETKSGTDVFDQLCGNYSYARKTPRWPLRLFFGIIDQAGVNSCILWNLLAEHEIYTRREFLNNLVLALVKPYLHDRMNIPRLPKETQQNIRVILGTTENHEVFESNKMAKRKRCAYCELSKDKKTFLCCSKCRKPVCEEHRYEICIHCVKL